MRRASAARDRRTSAKRCCRRSLARTGQRTRSRIPNTTRPKAIPTRRSRATLSSVTGPEALQDDLVEGDPDLEPAIRHAWASEVHPGRHCRTGRKDRPESTQRLHVGQDVHQGEDAHSAAYRGAGEPKNPLLRARPHRGQGHDEAGDHRGVDARIGEADQEHVADQAGQAAAYGRPDIFWVRECIRQEQRRPPLRRGSGLSRTRPGSTRQRVLRDIAQHAFHRRKSWNRGNARRRGRRLDTVQLVGPRRRGARECSGGPRARHGHPLQPLASLSARRRQAGGLQRRRGRNELVDEADESPELRTVLPRPWMAERGHLEVRQHLGSAGDSERGQ